MLCIACSLICHVDMLLLFYGGKDTLYTPLAEQLSPILDRPHAVALTVQC